MAPPAAQQQQQQQDAPADPAAPAGASMDARMAKVEQVQQHQGAVLDKVLAAVTGGQPAGAHAAPDGAQAPAPNIAEQVRQEIAAADERRRSEESERTWRAGVNEAVEKVKTENAPREPETGVRARLRRLVIGKDPE